MLRGLFVLELDVEGVVSCEEIGDLNPAIVLLREHNLLSHDLRVSLNDGNLSGHLLRPVAKAALRPHSRVETFKGDSEVLIHGIVELDAEFGLILQVQLSPRDLPAILRQDNCKLTEVVDESLNWDPKHPLLLVFIELDLSFELLSPFWVFVRPGSGIPLLSPRILDFD